jgi:hypothetical protein
MTSRDPFMTAPLTAVTHNIKRHFPHIALPHGTLVLCNEKVYNYKICYVKGISIQSRDSYTVGRRKRTFILCSWING